MRTLTLTPDIRIGDAAVLGTLGASDAPWPGAGAVHRREKRMPKLIWKPEFQTGVDAIDADHMHLVRIYNDLVAIAEGGGGSAGEALRDLFEHASLHFRREEAWLAAHGCPEDALEQHRFEHRVLLDHLKLLTIGATDDHDYRPSDETLALLHDWLAEHTQGSDRECVALTEKSLAEIEFEAMARLRKTPSTSSF